MGRIAFTSKDDETTFSNVPHDVIMNMMRMLLFMRSNPNNMCWSDNEEHTGNSVIIIENNGDNENKTVYNNIPYHISDITKSNFEKYVNGIDEMTIDSVTINNIDTPSTYIEMSESSRVAAEHGLLTAAESSRKVRVYNFMSTCNESDINTMFDSKAFNEISEGYLKHTLRAMVTDDVITRTQADQICRRYHKLFEVMPAAIALKE